MTVSKTSFMKIILKKIFILLLIIAANGELLSQQLPNYGAYRDHWYIINPAALTNNYLIDSANISIGASYRKQWIGLEEAPVTQSLSFQYILPSNRVVTGLQIINDQTGLLGNTGIYGQFAYRIPLSQNQEISIGLNAGFIQYKAEISKIDFRDVEEQALEDEGTSTKPDFSFGAFYHYADRFYLGVSVPQVFALNSSLPTDAGDFYLQRVRHYYALVGGFVPVNLFGFEGSYMEPTVWLRYLPNAPLNIDASFRYRAGNVFWLGAGAGVGFGTSTTKTMKMEVGFIFGAKGDNDSSLTKLGFNFEIPFSTYRQSFGNSIELNLVYTWKE